MAAKLEQGKSLKRELKVYGIEAPVILTLSHEGLKAQLKGTKTAVEQSWPQVIESMNTPGNVPSFLAGRAYDFLKHQAQKMSQRKEKKAQSV